MTGGIQARFAPAVLANRLVVAEHWGRPCLGYLLLLQPDLAAATAFTALQQEVLALEPTLLRQPERAMHCSVNHVLPVLADLGRPKDEIWRERGAEWLASIAAAVGSIETAGPVRLSFRRLVMTDAAIIAVAGEPNPISALRRDVSAALNLPWPVSRGDLVHLTLFRYRGLAADPATLLRTLADWPIAIDTEVGELLVVRETSFPLLDFAVLHRLPVPGQLPSGTWQMPASRTRPAST